MRQQGNGRHALSRLTLTLLLCAMCPSLALAAPGSILIEGSLRAKGGGPVADGTYQVEFGIWDKQSGGTKAWSEKAKIAVSKGAFQHVLGSVSKLSVAALSKMAQPWLSARVENDPELGRRRIHSVAWAVHAQVAHSVACTGCVGVSALKPDADLDLGARALKAAKLTAQQATIGTVVAASFVGDGSKLTGIKTASGSCKVGQVMVGINGDGTVKCGAALDIKNLPDNALTAFSGGALTNEFNDKFTSATAPRDIPDNNPSGVTDVIDVPDIGTAKSVKVSVNIAGTSGINGLRALLFDPSFGPLPADVNKGGVANQASFVLHDKSGSGPALLASFPPAKLAKGDLTKWHGKNPKGKWSLVLVDSVFKDNKVDGKLLTWSIEIATVAHKKVQATGTFIANGGLKLPVLAKSPYPCNDKWRGFTYVDAATDAVHICRKSGLWGTFSIHECGNKKLEPGETCDDGNNANGDGCDALCIKECGNGKLDVGEECDPQHAATQKHCSPSCKVMKFGKLWLQSSWTQWYPVKYPHSTYKESLAVSVCKSVDLRLWRDEGGPKSHADWAWDFNGAHNLGGHDICYKVSSATSNSQQGHTGTWQVFGKTWSDDLKAISGCGNGQRVHILNHYYHSGSNENSASWCGVVPQSNSVTSFNSGNGAISNMKCAVVLCARHK